jgi:AbrB family looped-hinge helix DNA binding protein
MSYTISMDKSGRIVIPKEVRERIGADETTKFDLDILLNHIELRPKESTNPEPKVFKEGRMWVISSEGEPFDATASIRAIREERLDRTTPEESGK